MYVGFHDVGKSSQKPPLFRLDFFLGPEVQSVFALIQGS